MTKLRYVFFILLMALGVGSALGVTRIDIGQQTGGSRVPAWDERGLGPLPWQGISCADISDNGRFMAVGTMAPYGDPNVFLLGEDGTVIEQRAVGIRWINEIAVANTGGYGALSSTFNGQPTDRPVLFLFVGGKEQQEQPRPLYLHYGDNSNHLAPTLHAIGDELIYAKAHGYEWFNTRTGAKRHMSTLPLHRATATTHAFSRNERLALGQVLADDNPTDVGNLALFSLNQGPPLWRRAGHGDPPPAPKLEAGVYGPHVEYSDATVYAPLAVAINGDGSRVAAADYRGWSRTRVSHRFVPARPVIAIYGEEGQLLRRVDPEHFDQPFWADLAFTHDGSKVLAYPHNWTSRGLAGQAILPADDDANRLYVIDVETGVVTVVAFPDAISSVSPHPAGGVVVGCWDGRVYALDADFSLTWQIDVGGPSFVKTSGDGSRILVAATQGSVHLLNADGVELWQVVLDDVAESGDKPWTRFRENAPLVPGVWTTGRGLTHSDMGGQYLIEAPEGLIMIDPNAGAAIEANWASIEAAGFDPMDLKYVLITHEHGDHAPGAYLWRVITGARVVASAETAYNMRHHLPAVSGYGFHPPNPVDIVIDHDRELDLAGLPMKAIRLPGHTYGCTGWVFEKEGKKYAAIGDLIMSGGRLGYAGSRCFSAEHMLESLNKLETMTPDMVLGGHGRGASDLFIRRGIDAGEATGWGKMEPPKPDPFYGLAGRNYHILAWRQNIVSAVYGDIDGDGQTDVAVLRGTEEGSAIDIYLNRGGQFDPEPNVSIAAAGLTGRRLRMGHMNDDGIADFFMPTDRQLAVFASQGGLLEYAQTMIDAGNAIHILPTDITGNGLADLVIGGRFLGSIDLVAQTEPGQFQHLARRSAQMYFDMQLMDLNNNGRDDLVTSGGAVFLRLENGGFAEAPVVQLEAFDGWNFMAAADFNGDGWNEVVLLSQVGNAVALRIFENTRDPEKPYRTEPAREIRVPNARLLRDGPTVADWNGDGISDLILGGSGGRGAVILLGGENALVPGRLERITLDYVPHFDAKFGVADFNNDGRPDIASFGPSVVGAPAVYIWLQETP